MNPTVYLSCLVVFSLFYLGKAQAENDDEFATEKQRLLRVYGDSSVDEATRYRNVDDLVKFYDKYSTLLPLKPDLTQRAQDLVRRYKEESARVVLVDGAPAQGGFWLPLVKLLIVQLGVEIASEGFKRAIES
ncbi:protein Turandot M [Drosophila yakuba]|uniref:Protein Turandot M n=1 Tax=Drosophila yakuba TaxID=7245 RepID=TOTM_DROYA|nr:protein Turandot M [Drosophila yakuba]XP_039226450.1 protein Turandot M [Drosophila yakuba]B4P071.1 RecName: Full=Protein Turandot M; Flags: Precursor [Drosophila yakuba]